MARPFYVPEDASAGKAAILEAALVLFTTRGLNGTSIRDIADAASVSNPALYKHFPSKEELALNLFVSCYGRLVGRAQRAMAPKKSAVAKARAYVEAYVGAFDECPHAAIFVNDHFRELWPEAKNRLPQANIVKQTVDLVEALRREKKSRHSVPSELVVAGFLGTLTQCARFAFAGGLEHPTSRSPEALLHLLLHLAS